MAEYPTKPVIPETLKCLDWMGGVWIEDQEDRRCEEVWSTPDAHALMGMFRWISDEDVSFYEFMVIQEADDGIEMHVKHFHPSLVAWEERDRFQGFVLTEVAERRATFASRTAGGEPDGSLGWLTYVRTPEDRLLVRLIEPDGTVKLTFHYLRVL